MTNDDERKSQDGSSVTFTGCTMGGVPISGTFATLDQVANTFSSDEPESVSMARALVSVLREVTDFAVENAGLAGPVTLMSGTTGTFQISDYEGVEYEIFVRARPV